MTIDMEGIADRVVALPLKSGDYRNLAAVEGGILYITDGKLKKYNIADEKEEDILDRAMQALVTSVRL